MPANKDPALEGVIGAGGQRGTGDFLTDFLDPDVNSYVGRQLRGRGIPTAVDNEAKLQSNIDSRLAQGPRANPYDLGLGNQARDGFMASLDALHNGTSVVQGQAQQAQGQLTGQVMQAAANSSGLSQALAAGVGAQGASQIAGQAGNARLGEFMGQQEQYAGGLGAMRNQDQNQASAFNTAGLNARAQDDALTNFYSDANVNLGAAGMDLTAKRAELEQKLKVAKDQQNWQAVQQITQAIATAAKMAAGGI